MVLNVLYDVSTDIGNAQEYIYSSKYKNCILTEDETFYKEGNGKIENNMKCSGKTVMDTTNKKNILLLILLLFQATFAQSGKTSPIITISGSCKLGFKTYDKEFNMYQNPFILNDGKKYSIKGYNHANYSGGKILSISPDKKYIVLDYISKGYVDDGINKTLYENYLCVIVDVAKRKVVTELQGDCGGHWNKQNRWINDGKIIF